jgi:pentatricopeptide repeat protein
VSAQKLSRRQLKQDSFVDWTAKSVEFIQENYVRLAIGIGAVVVLAIAVSLYFQGQHKAREQASFLLYQGESLMYRGAYDAARERLQQCHERYGGTLFGKRAGLDLGHAYLALGDPAQALATLEGLEPQVAGRGEMHRELQLLKGAALVDLERYAEAEALYRQMQSEDLHPNERYEVGMRLADCLKLSGRVQEGLNVLEDLKASADRGDIPTESRDLDMRLQVFRALAL